MTTSLARRQLRTICAPLSRRESWAGRTSRRTSGFVTRTSTIRAPERSRSRSRAIVSVSGSSGTAHRFAPPDVVAELLVLEPHSARVLHASGVRVIEGIANAGYGEHSAASRDQ